MTESLQINKEQSKQFADLSGDWNPMHLDPVAARRLQFGDTVIHGVHGTLSALDQFFLNQPAGMIKLDSIKVTYANPVVQGTPLELNWTIKAPGQVQLNLMSQGKRAQMIKISYSVSSVQNHKSLDDQLAAKAMPDELSIEDAANLTGKLRHNWSEALATALFPSLCDSVSYQQIAQIIALTRIVGMKCPGLHSIFAGFTSHFADTEAAVSEFCSEYQISSADNRFNRVLIDVHSMGMKGEVEAIFRTPPVTQASLAAIRKRVNTGVFTGQRALIIGGSRGLGEVTAKIISAGGGDVILTYASGLDDANRVKSEITESGGQCQVFHLDITQPDKYALNEIFDSGITHLYHFSSPKISKNEQHFDNAKLQQYLQHYLFGLNDILSLAVEKCQYRTRELCIFIPSSVFIDESKAGFAEYATAKLAAEKAMESIVNKYAGWTLVAPRLTPLLTDQTAGVAQSSALDTVETMLSHLSGH